MKARNAIILIFSIAALSACSRKPDAVDEVAAIFTAHSASKITAEEVRSVLLSEGKDGLAELDKYSLIAGSAQKRLAMNQVSSGRAVGIGILTVQNGGYIQISRVIERSPAWQAGLMEGDIILELNGKSVVGLTMPQARELLAARGGNEVVIMVERRQGTQAWRFEFTLRKMLYKVPLVSSSIGPGGVGYLRIANFTFTAAADARAEMEKLAAAGVRFLVIDLRYNNGGPPSQAAGVLRLFVGGGRILFSARSDKPDYNTDYKAGASAPYGNLRCAVLVNRQTSSGAEIMAESLRENAGALLVGAKTAGEAGIQKMFPLSDGRALRLTVAYLTPPSGAALAGKGITPDVMLASGEQDEERINRFLSAYPGRIPDGDPAYAQAAAILTKR